MFYSKNLKKIKEIKHCFFSRNGGYSKGIYNSLNCGIGSKDNKINIKKNLKYVSKKINVKPNNLKLMYQTHSNKVVVISMKNKNAKNFKSDAIVSNLKGYALGVVTADCVPILLCDVSTLTIGCIHAGWKGAFTGVIENTVRKLKKMSKKSKILASVGPCIGKMSYEVDLVFYKKFIFKSKSNSVYFSKKNKNKKYFNLRKYVSDKLSKLNIKVENVNYDTYKDKNKFFSYRRSQKLGENDYGRCISVIGLTNFSQN